MMQWEVMQENYYEVELRMNLATYQLFLNFMKQQMEQRKQLFDHNQGIKRRIIPFFMNQFYLWSQESEIECVRELLYALKKIKTSRQKKFELGDLKKIFKSAKIEGFPTEKVQEYWKDFLQTQAEKRVVKNNKAKRREEYLEFIPLLLDELNRNVPYARFLSIHREQQIIQQQQEVDLIADLSQDSNYNQNFISLNDSERSSTLLLS